MVGSLHDATSQVHKAPAHEGPGGALVDLSFSASRSLRSDDPLLRLFVPIERAVALLGITEQELGEKAASLNGIFQSGVLWLSKGKLRELARSRGLTPHPDLGPGGISELRQPSSTESVLHSVAPSPEGSMRLEASKSAPAPATPPAGIPQTQPVSGGPERRPADVSHKLKKIAPAEGTKAEHKPPPARIEAPSIAGSSRTDIWVSKEEALHMLRVETLAEVKRAYGIPLRAGTNGHSGRFSMKSIGRLLESKARDDTPDPQTLDGLAEFLGRSKVELRCLVLQRFGGTALSKFDPLAVVTEIQPSAVPALTTLLYRRGAYPGWEALEHYCLTLKKRAAQSDKPNDVLGQVRREISQAGPIARDTIRAKATAIEVELMEFSAKPRTQQDMVRRNDLLLQKIMLGDLIRREEAI